MQIHKLTSLLNAGATSHRASALPTLRQGEWQTLLDIDGPGMITHLWFTFPPTDKMLGRRILMRIFWDDEPDPSVEAPLADFFGVPFGFSGAEFQLASRYLVVAPQNGLNCYFQMPFARRARIEIFPEQTESRGGFYFQADYVKFPEPPAAYRDLRFHAQFRFEHPCQNYGRNYLFLDALGSGALLGATFGIEVNHPQPDAWFHGGGDSIFIDGEANPSVLHGIGAEDFFGHSWGVRRFQSPAIGTPYRELDKDGRVRRVALYRFFDNDPVLFHSSIRAVLGALGNNYSSVAYWYQREPHRRFFQTPPADQRMPDTPALYGSFDLEPAAAPEWQLLAPFKIDERHPFEHVRPFEAHESGDEEYEYQAAGDPAFPGGNQLAVRWQPQQAHHHFADFNTVARPALTRICLQSSVAGYALRYIESEANQDVLVHVAFDDEMIVRINEQMVFHANHAAGFAPAAFKAHLRKGRNRILIKLSNYDNTTWKLWAFSFRIEKETGSQIR